MLLRKRSGAAYRVLLDLGEATGTRAAQRDWAHGWARQQTPRAIGETLVAWALAEDDLDAAFAAAAEFGPGTQ